MTEVAANRAASVGGYRKADSEGKVDVLNIGVLQHAPTPLDTTEGLQRISAHARSASAAECDLLVVPEASLTGYNISKSEAEAIALREGDPVLGELDAIARDHRIALAVGYIERDVDQLHNTVRLVDMEGHLITCYRKTHLWDSLDRSLFAAGDALAPIIDLRGWRLGVLICYDVEFPETVRRLALEGAELVLVPTALMHPYTFVADHMTRVRAAENGIFLAYANYCGQENGLDYAGRSVIAAPDGSALARAGDHEELIIATLERQAIAAARQSLPYLDERRPELYDLRHGNEHSR